MGVSAARQVFEQARNLLGRGSKIGAGSDRTRREIKFLEDEIDRLEIEIMPLRFQQEGYRMLLEKRRRERT